MGKLCLEAMAPKQKLPIDPNCSHGSIDWYAIPGARARIAMLWRSRLPSYRDNEPADC